METLVSVSDLMAFTRKFTRRVVQGLRYTRYSHRAWGFEYREYIRIQEAQVRVLRPCVVLYMF